jgi:hypothetical protein
MGFSQWLKANGYDEAALSADQRKHLEAAWKSETQPTLAAVATPPPAAPAPANPPAPAAQPTAQSSAPSTGSPSFDQKLVAIEEENQRIEYIENATIAAMQSRLGDKQKCKQLRELAEAAKADKKMDAKSFDVALMRIDRAIPPMVTAPKAESNPLTAEVVEAALCISEKLPDLEKHYDSKVLQTAHSKFRHGLGLQELLLLAAERNGNYRGSVRDLKPLLKAAFQGDGHEMRADVVPSTLSISGILSNIANKFLRVAFENVEQSWRKITTIRPVNDFKTITSYSLTGDNQYEQVPAGGEIQAGTLGQTSYTNKADTYAKLLGIDRRDIINDDLGALTGAGRRLGRGAALKLNAIFWAVWLNDSTFFPTDKSKANYDDGAGDSVLNPTGLANADTIFRQQTDPDGKPLGAIPKILLVPTPLRTTALNLMSSEFYNLVTATNPAGGTGNIWRGMFEPVDSAYLGAANTGGSDTAWYLLADPNDIAVIETCFLNGAEMPTIETGEPDFDRLGLAMRGWYDFGVSLQEYRGAVKLKGAA